MNDKEKKLEILNVQTFASFLFIVSLIVTIILTYNQKQYTLNKKPIFNNKETYIISNANRILVLIIVLMFLYSSYELREISKKKGSNVMLNNLDVFASVLSVIGAIIVLYITANSPVENSLDIENPNI